MKEITHNNLPEAVAELLKQVAELREQVENCTFQHKESTEDIELFTVGECAKLLRRSEQTLYKWVKEGKIPAFRQNDRIYLLKRDVYDFIRSAKIKEPDNQAASEVEEYLVGKN